MQTLSVAASEHSTVHRSPGQLSALGELLSKEPAAAMVEASAWLDAVPLGLSVQMRLEQLLRLDEVVRPQARRLGRDYLTSPRLGSRQEYRLWQINNDYWTRLVGAYENCLERYAAGEAGADGIAPALGLLYTRLLHAYVACHKWARFRYGPMGSRLWSGPGLTYLGAVDAGLAGNTLFAFPGAGSQTSPEREYLKVLMLHASALDNLLPLEMEIALHLITYFLPYFTFTDALRHGNVFWIDAAKPLPPTRLTRRPELTATLRFFSAGKALKAVAELRRRIAEAGEVPADIALGRQYSAGSVLPVLDHLALYWGPAPARSKPRHPVKSRLTVVHGLAAIQSRLEGSSDAAGEAWIGENVSGGGIGAKVSLAANDWVRIGALLGIQPEGGDNWLVGVIRRYNRETETQGLVGIETLGKAPRAITVVGSGANGEAILLDTPHVGDTASLLLVRGAFDETAAVTFELDGAKLRLQPLTLAETGTDFALGRYRVEAC